MTLVGKGIRSSIYVFKQIRSAYVVSAVSSISNCRVNRLKFDSNHRTDNSRAWAACGILKT